MAFTKVEIYNKTLGAVGELKEEIAKTGRVKAKVLEVEDQWRAQKTTEARSQFMDARYEEIKSALNGPLITFYKKALKSRKKNFGDPPFEDSAVVVDIVEFLEQYFNVSVIEEAHFAQLKKDIEQALVAKKIKDFLDHKKDLEVAGSAGASGKGRKEFTVKQQALALYFLLKDVLDIDSVDKTNIAMLLHLLAGKSIPRNKERNAAIKDGGLYEAYRNAAQFKSDDSLTDLLFVKSQFEKFGNQAGFRKLLSEKGELAQRIHKLQSPKSGGNPTKG